MKGRNWLAERDPDTCPDDLPDGEVLVRTVAALWFFWSSRTESMLAARVQLHFPFAERVVLSVADVGRLIQPCGLTIELFRSRFRLRGGTGTNELGRQVLDQIRRRQISTGTVLLTSKREYGVVSRELEAMGIYPESSNP